MAKDKDKDKAPKEDRKPSKQGRGGGLGFQKPSSAPRECRDCGGSGMKDGKTCSRCSGTGEV